MQQSNHVGAWLAVGAIAALSACSAERGSLGQPAPVSVRVMTFNVEYGGTGVDFDKVTEAVQLANADIVALEEPYGNARRLAEALGWPYASTRTDVISRYPLLDPPDADGRYVWAEVEPGQVVAVANVHLPSDPYGPYFTANCPPSALMQLERETRLPAIAPVIERLSPLAAEGLPVFLLGDFNAPSHRDWTEQTLLARPQLVYPMEWPVSVAVEAAGFVDSYRAVYPDPAAKPGLTWWANRPNIEDEFPASDPLDRIDLVYSAGPAQTRASQIIGEVGAADVDVSVSPWPSDHRAVVSEFVVTPAWAPPFISVDARLLTVGEPLLVRAGGDRSARQVTLQLASSVPPEPPLLGIDLSAGSVSEVLEVPTLGLEPGAYEVRLVSEGGGISSRAPVWLQAEGSLPRLVTDAPRYRSGEPIGVSWQGAPGNRWDWVGVYRAPADPSVDEYLVWGYLDAQVEGRLLLDERAQGGSWPLEPGSYEALLLLYDAYDVAARTTFEVTEGEAPGAEPAAPSEPAWDAECTTAVAP
jgi:endonuclease/exonuclease/phosphatase family metal-dependent hydrolase